MLPSVPALALMVMSAALIPEVNERTEFAIGDRGFAVASVVEDAASAGFRGVVLAADGGEVACVVAVGGDDDGPHAIRADTVFELASVTKQFTGAAIMRLVQDGLLSLDDPIGEHLPGVPDECSAITVRHLLQHTSGIPGTNTRGGGEAIEAVLPSFLDGGPRHAPGTRWEYWNSGYALLSEIIARASGEAYTAYVRRVIFEPAGMRSACFTGDAAPEGVPVARGLSGMGPARTALEHPYGAYGLQYRGMGGAVAGVWDLWRWDRALDGDAVLDAGSKAALFEPGLNGYALGWFVREVDGMTVQSHGGAVRGFTAELRRYPDRDGLIVVLCADDRYRPGGLADSVAAALFGDGAGEGDGDVAAGGDAELGALAGRYESGGAPGAPGNTVLFVERADGAGRAPVRIVWRGNGPVTRALIERDGDGGLVLSDGAGTYAVSARVVDGVVAEVSIQIDPNGAAMAFARHDEE
ncbi:MAG: serine hydrolase domain-containing protein [Phycisphaerales bacterium]